jgi:metal-sulfur cluster biosynthetic enzyme
MPELTDKVWEAIKQVYDPEIPVNVADMGLIYEIREYPINNIYIRMTVTAQHCPAAVFLPEQVKEAAKKSTGVNDVYVELVYDPPWTRERMTKEAQKILGYK